MASGKHQGLQSVKNTWVILEVGQYGGLMSFLLVNLMCVGVDSSCSRVNFSSGNVWEAEARRAEELTSSHGAVKGAEIN